MVSVVNGVTNQPFGCDEMLVRVIILGISYIGHAFATPTNSSGLVIGTTKPLTLYGAAYANVTANSVFSHATETSTFDLSAPCVIFVAVAASSILAFMVRACSTLPSSTGGQPPTIQRDSGAGIP